jgi:hypothetical protein
MHTYQKELKNKSRKQKTAGKYRFQLDHEYALVHCSQEIEIVVASCSRRPKIVAEICSLPQYVVWLVLLLVIAKHAQFPDVSVGIAQCIAQRVLLTIVAMSLLPGSMARTVLTITTTLIQIRREHYGAILL